MRVSAGIPGFEKLNAGNPSMSSTVSWNVGSALKIAFPWRVVM